MRPTQSCKTHLITVSNMEELLKFNQLPTVQKDLSLSTLHYSEPGENI